MIKLKQNWDLEMNRQLKADKIGKELAEEKIDGYKIMDKVDLAIILNEFYKRIQRKMKI